MSRRENAIDAAVSDIERARERERRARLQTKRSAERHADEDREDRELRRRRMRATQSAPDDERERVADKYDHLEAEVLRDRTSRRDD